MPMPSLCLRPLFHFGLALAGMTLLVSCAPEISGVSKPGKTPSFADLDREISQIVQKHGVRTAGIGLLRGGRLVWTGYYGEQAPGVRASRTTLFNVASMTKTVTAETVLRLAAAGKLSLDESMAPYWVDPDVASDPQHILLTPRMALSHATGFLNWRFFARDGKLRFVNPPGTKFGYSGEGMEYVARFAEKKTGRDFSLLANDEVMTPSRMKSTFLKTEVENFARIATPYDESGKQFSPYCRPNAACRPAGRWGAADDMMTTVEDYAAFLIGVMRHQGLSAGLIAERERVQTARVGKDAVIDCSALPTTSCPKAQGYGLGWEVIDYGNDKLLGHTGSDWSEMSVGYFHTKSKDGVIVFLNGPNANDLVALPEILELLDPNSVYARQIRRWRPITG
jgi:CubicO group peptidase (beta-lactamase class C family)